MQKTIVIRAYMLEKGESFLMNSREYYVKSNNGTTILYGTKHLHPYGYMAFGGLQTMGAQSRERVLLIIN